MTTTHSPTGGAQIDADSLNRDIMNLPCTVPREAWEHSYKLGHRDARHAAAELVSAALARAGQQAGEAAQPRFIPDAECKQRKCARPTVGCLGRCGLEKDEHQVACVVVTAGLSVTHRELSDRLGQFAAENASLRIENADLRAQLASAQQDAERLDFMADYGAWIAWGKDRERCRVFHRTEEGDDAPIMGWSHPNAWHADPRDAIDVARAQLTNTTEN